MLFRSHTESNQLFDNTNSANFDLVRNKILNIIKRKFSGQISFDDMKDCVQHAIIKYDKLINNGVKIGNNYSWLVKVASNMAIDICRINKRNQRFRNSNKPVDNSIELNHDDLIDLCTFIEKFISNNVLTKKLEFELFYHTQELGEFNAKLFADTYKIKETKVYKLRSEEHTSELQSH